MRRVREPIPITLWMVYFAWAEILTDFHYFLGAMVAQPLGKLATLIFLPLALVTALQGPTIMATMKSWVWYPPFLLLLVAAVASLPVAVNLLMAKIGLQTLAFYYILAVATAAYVKTPKQAYPILVMLWVRFIWWAIWARGSGQVPWHPSLSNFDGFGGLMVHGAALCFWFALAVPTRRLRILLFALSAYCVLGVVASFARGAFLALIAVAILIWLRSPRKGLTAAGMVLAVVVVGGAAALIVGVSPDTGNGFFQEMMSSFTEGTSEGTGGQRWTLWMSAVKVWMEYPIFGVGPNNFGAFASTFFRQGEVTGFEDPLMFYGFNLHSAYFEILSEMGIVGCIAFAWAMVDFVLKNRALRKPEAAARWAASGMGAKFNLRYLSLALEGAMAATFLGNMVYAAFFESWFIVLWSANRMLWAVTRSEAERGTVTRAMRGVRAAVRRRAPT